MDGVFGNLMLGFSVAMQPSVLAYAFAGCVIGGVASFRLSGDLSTNARDATSTLGYAGLRGEARIPFARSFAAVISLEAVGTFGAVTLEDATTGKPLWSSSPVAGALSAGIAWTLQ